MMMKGLPCSGKTEWATKWANQKASRRRLSWSDILNAMGGRYSRERRPIAFDGMLRMMCVALRHGKDVVIDECNLNSAEYGIILTRAMQCKVRTEWHTMKTTADECKIRAREQGKAVTDMDIDRLALRYAAWLKHKH